MHTYFGVGGSSTLMFETPLVTPDKDFESFAWFVLFFTAEAVRDQFIWLCRSYSSLVEPFA